MLRFLRKLIYRPRPVFHASNLQILNASGPELVAFQNLFNQRVRRYGIRVDITGVYDEQTRESVRSYQRLCFSILNSDGFVGPQTARKLRIRLI